MLAGAVGNRLPARHVLRRTLWSAGLGAARRCRPPRVPTSAAAADTPSPDSSGPLPPVPLRETLSPRTRRVPPLVLPLSDQVPAWRFPSSAGVLRDEAEGENGPSWVHGGGLRTMHDEMGGEQRPSSTPVPNSTSISMRMIITVATTGKHVPRLIGCCNAVRRYAPAPQMAPSSCLGEDASTLLKHFHRVVVSWLLSLAFSVSDLTTSRCMQIICGRLLRKTRTPSQPRRTAPPRRVDRLHRRASWEEETRLSDRHGLLARCQQIGIFQAWIANDRRLVRARGTNEPQRDPAHLIDHRAHGIGGL